jgi:hypothetical protein
MAAMQTFSPAYAAGTTVAPTNVSASTIIGLNSKSLCLTNLGTVIVYVRTFNRQNGVVAATTADYPVPFSQVTITKPDDHDAISYIVAGGVAGSLHIIPGEGF